MAYVLDDNEKRVIDNEEWPVTTEIVRDVDCVTYHVVVGDADNGAGYGLWTKVVEFGRSHRFRAGGAAFVEAAREQEEVAQAIVTYLESK